MSLNTVTISRNLGDDPDFRQTSSGTAVCKLSVCVNQRVKRDNEWTNKPNWVNVTVWGKRGETCANNLRKGQQVYIVGHLNQNKWQDDKGNNYSRLEVIADQVEWQSNKQNSGKKLANTVVDASVYDSDIPF